MKRFFEIDSISDNGEITHLNRLYRSKKEAESAARIGGINNFAIISVTWAEVLEHAKQNREGSGIAIDQD